MWRALGREIVSVDLVGSDILRFDLNQDSVPPGLNGYFDLVTNFGTSEHVFNQVNCFRVIHDLVKVNGLMLHAVPCAGYDDHGLFTYPIKFFWRLCDANGYDCLDAWMSLPGNVRKDNVWDFMWNPPPDTAMGTLRIVVVAPTPTTMVL